MKRKIIFINSHPIQYFAPLYEYMNDKGLETICWYCSDESIKGGLDHQFGVDVKWDIPLLKGYKYKFFKNYSWKPSHTTGFFGLINLGMIKELSKIPNSVVVVHGWHYFTHLMILLLGRLKGHVVCMRYEMPQKQEVLRKTWKQVLKRLALKYLLFPQIDYFLYIGSENYSMYKSLGLPDGRLIFCPYSVDNHRFGAENQELKVQIPAIKKKLGIPFEDKIILYAGKYIEKKRPLDLLKAYIKLNQSNVWLIMAGEGALRKEMEKLITEHRLQRIILTGFINQSNISQYYAISDVFVMCSTIGETWGLSVNEAMNFNLPLILSDLTGCADDLVKEGVNGYTFKTGDIDDLVIKLRHILLENALTKATSSIDIVHQFSYDTIVGNVSALV